MAVTDSRSALVAPFFFQGLPVRTHWQAFPACAFHQLPMHRACYRRQPAKRRISEMAEAGVSAAKRADSGMLAAALDRDSPADMEFARNWVPQDLQVTEQLHYGPKPSASSSVRLSCQAS